MKKDTERGAIVIEATISLTAFVFTLFTILMLVNIFFIQAKIGTALNSSAKEISQYSYLYYKLGIASWEQGVHEQTKEARETADKTIDGVGELMDAFNGFSSGLGSGNFDEMLDSIDNGTATIDSLVTMYGDQISDNPEEFIIGMGKLAGEELGNTLKVYLGQALAKSFMRKNLMEYEGDDPDKFLKRYRVVDGMDGLNFNYSSLMAYGSTTNIQLVVTYDVRVIRLLNIDFTFTFRQCAKTSAWGNGISLIKPEISTPTADPSVWDQGQWPRGDAIIETEKENYEYTAVTNRKGYHAYNNAGGANEFVKITTIDTHSKSYQTVSALAGQISQRYEKFIDDMEGVGNPITVNDSKGNAVELDSDPSTRTYRLILVIPDDSDMSLVQQALEEFRSKHPGAIVEIKTGYGSPTPVEQGETEG